MIKKFLRSISRSTTTLGLVTGLTGLLAALVPDLVCAQEIVPEPKRAFSPNAALIVYGDQQTASRSGIWKTLEDRMTTFTEQMSSLPGFDAAMTAQFDTLPGIQSEDIAEWVIVIEGRNAFQNLESGRLDPDFGFTMVWRLNRLVDTAELIRDVLEAIETEQPGLRAKIEPTRARVGAAEFFDLPAESIGEVSMPFPMSAAVGPGKEGTVIGFGKRESLRAFVTGQTAGVLPPGISGSLARRGQIWAYLPLNQGILGGLAGAGGTENPMIAGLVQEGLDKVKEFGMGLSFGSAKVDVELVVGCVDNAAARELGQNVQQFLALMQMMAAQNPASTPPFVGKLRAASDAATFRVTTELTARDLDMMLQTVSPGTPTTTRPPTTRTAPPPVTAPAPRTVPVTVTVLELLPGDMQSLRHTRLQVDNHSNQAIRDMRLTFHYHDQAGHRIGQWSRRHVDPVSDVLVAADTSREIRCPTYHVPAATRRVTVTLHEVTFADGSRWTAGR